MALNIPTYKLDETITVTLTLREVLNLNTNTGYMLRKRMKDQRRGHRHMLVKPIHSDRSILTMQGILEKLTPLLESASKA